MFERFTDRAKKINRLAGNHAKRLNHERVAPEHILLGLIEEGSGVGAHALRRLGVELRDIQQDVERQWPAGPDMLTIGRLPFDDRSMELFKHTIDEARYMHCNYVGSEHLLLGVFHTGGVASQVLGKHGLDIEKVRTEVGTILGAQVKEDLSPHQTPMHAWLNDLRPRRGLGRVRVWNARCAPRAPVAGARPLQHPSRTDSGRNRPYS